MVPETIQKLTQGGIRVLIQPSDRCIFMYFRVPLVPETIQKLTQGGIRVLIQPSDRRIFTNDEFKKVHYKNFNHFFILFD